MTRFFKALCLTLLSVPIITNASSVVILQYHHVSDNTPVITSVTPDVFKQHLDYLEDKKFNVISLTEATSALQSGQSLPEKSVVITFDDAYRNIHTNAFPMLKEKGWPFTIFVATAPVDKNYGKFLSWKQLQEMTQHGATITNHTIDHDHSVERLPEETETQWVQRFRDELDATEKRIKEKTGQSVKHFAWNFGETAPQLRNALKDMGYVGLGQQSGAASKLSDFTRLPRYPMAGNYGGSDFAIKVNSLALPVLSATPDSSLIDSENTQPVLTVKLDKGDYQKKQLKCYATGQGELEVKWLDDAMTSFTTQVKHPLAVGRSRYNCTAPSNSGRQYYWFSHAWLRLTDEGKALD